MSTPEGVGPVELVTLVELKPNDRNPRIIRDHRFAQLKRSLEADPEMLWARPVIALMDGTIVAGNMRYRAAEDLGWSDIPTVRVDLDEERAKVWVLRDNQGYGEWDEALLAELLYELQEAGADLDLTGFDKDETKRLLATVAGEDGGGKDAEDRSTILQLLDVTMGDPEHVVTRGDVWKVGRHYLLCVSVYDGWREAVKWLTTACDQHPEGYLAPVLLVPYPTPTITFAERAKEATLVLVQPDPWIAGHIIDKVASVEGADAVERVA